MNDFILECSPKAKKSAPLEANSLAEVLQALRTHNEVAWVRRQSTGAAKIQGRYIQFGWAGCSDLLSMLKNGRLLAVKCGRPKGSKVSSERVYFLAMINHFGGCAFIATSAIDVFNN